MRYCFTLIMGLKFDNIRLDGIFKILWYFLLTGMVATVESRFPVTHVLQELQSSILEDNVIISKNQETTPIFNVMMEHSNVFKTLSICLDLYTQKFHQISMELHELASCIADRFPETKKSAEALLLLDGIEFDVLGLFMGSEEKFSISPTLSFDMFKTKIVISPTLKTDIMSTAEVEKGPTNDVNRVNKVLCFPFANLTIVQIIGRLQSMILEAQQIVQQEIEPLAARLTDCTNSNYTSVNETEYMVAIQQEAKNYTTNIKRAMTVLNETINALQANMTDCMGILDCNGQCNGTSRLQEICHDISYGGKGTKYRNETEYPDCSATLEMKSLYSNDTCYACISMEKLLAVEKDACGVCGGDNSTCMGCDGVPNSGNSEHEHGICGRYITQYPRVDSIQPSIIPNIEKTLTVIGTAFNSSGLMFILQNESSTSIPTREPIIINTGRATFVVPVLLPGTYTVHSTQGLDGKPSNSSATLKVYDKDVVNTTGVTQDTDVIGDSLKSTVKIDVTQIYEGPVYCIVKGMYLNRTEVFNGILMDGKISCNIDVPMVSARGTIFASLNKQDLIGLGHQITYYAKSPVVVSHAFDSTGQFIILTFDTDVNTRGLDTCNKILSDVSKLGTNTKCTWISGRELKIVLPSDATILNGDTLSLMKGIKAARQVYGKEASTGPNPVSLPMTVPPPVISIEGPEEVGSCQTNVSYMVSILKGLGSRPFKSIVWSLNKDGVRYDSAFNVMEFSTQLTELGVYEVNITVKNFLTIASTTSINVTKTNQSKPIAVLDTDLEKSTEGLPIIRLNKGFSAWTNIIFGVDCEKGPLSFKWKLDDVVLNSTQRMVTFGAFSITNTMCGKTVTLAVSVSLNTLKPITSTVVAKVVCRKPVPVITGGSEVEVGVRSGQIIIDGSRTFDPENAEVTYKWECLQGPASSSEEPADSCISHLPSESINITFPTDREKSEANLTFDAARFSAGSKYKFTLTATSVKGGTTFNDTISIMYTAVDGNMPLVEILTTKRKFRSDVVIIIESRIRSSVQVVTEWSFVEDTGYDTKNITAVGKQTLSPGRMNNIYISQLEIGKDTLSAGAKYKVKLRVSLVSNSSIFIETCTEIAIYEDITGCTINARDYAEYDMAAIEFLGCATDSEGYPLTYTLQLGSQILATTSDTILKIPGPPLKDRTLTNATFTVIVRNSVGQVKTFESQEVTVTKKSKEDAALGAESLIAEAESTGDTVAALTHMNNKIISLQTAGTKDVKKALTLIKDIRENQLSPINARQALEVQSQLDITKFSEDEKKEAFTYQKSFLKELVSDETQSYTTDEVRNQLAHAQKLADTTDDRKTLQETESMITVLAVRDKGLNDPVEVTLDERMSSVKIIKTKLNAEITTKANKGANFQFPSELQERFSNWACDDKQDCEGVVLSMTTYNAVNNIFVGDTRRQCSDIIEIDLVNPVSGEIQEVIHLKEPLEMELPVTQSCDFGTNTKRKCYYYDSVTKEFKSDGLTTKSVSASAISCTTNHLTAFTSRNELAVVEELNKAIILGAVFGGVVLTVIVIVIVLLIVKKKSKVHSTY